MLIAAVNIAIHIWRLVDAIAKAIRSSNAGPPNKCPAPNATAVRDNTPASAMPAKFRAYYQKKVKKLSKMLSTILIGIDGWRPAKKASKHASNLATKNDLHLYVVPVIKEFGKLMERCQQHDTYIKELRKASKNLLVQSKPKVKELGR